MQYQNIKTAQAYESPTNPRGTKFSGPAFDDLVASIAAKGVLVPVIARQNPKNGKTWEVVAGNRRLRAAVKAGLAEIPAEVMQLSDDEAREVQIIENLQREDVHPLEEGEAYRHLVEERKFEIAAVAAKVGKSEAYVRQRLLLTNLIPAAAKAYRAGELNDGHAVLIARLAPKDQPEAIEYVSDNWQDITVDDLREWIKREFDQPLKRQPWLTDKEAAKAVGPCKECPPIRASLFGDVREGQCTSVACWQRKMAAYIEYAKKQNPDLVLVSTAYGGEMPKGILSRGQYHEIQGKKDGCRSAADALVAAGTNIGTRLRVCADGECKKHFFSGTSYALSPKEKERRKKERAAEQKRKDREAAKHAAIVAKVNWPAKGSQLDALVHLAVGRAVHDSLRNVAKRRGIEPKVTVSKWHDGSKRTERDWSAGVISGSAKMTDAEKGRLIFDLLLASCYSTEAEKATKLISAQ